MGFKIGDKVHLVNHSQWFKQQLDSDGNQMEGIIVSEATSYDWKIEWGNGEEWYYDNEDLELISSYNNYEIF